MTGMEWIAFSIAASIMVAIAVFVWKITSH
jgi:hypothetical protein